MVQSYEACDLVHMLLKMPKDDTVQDLRSAPVSWMREAVFCF